MVNEEKRVMSVEEAGRLCGLSRASAYAEIRRNELPHLRFERRIVVPKAALQKLLDEAQVESASNA